MDSGLIVPFGRYVLKERLAQGGMGEVFRAVAVGEHGFEKPVVVKRVLPAHAGREDLTELFVAEAKLMTRLSHPNIVEVLDFGRGERNDYYLVLELVFGVDLGRLVRAYSARGELFPVPLALFIVSQVLRGLHHAHTTSAGHDGEGGVIVHRDVSPSNVLCSAEGEVKVADFGVALVTYGGAAGDHTGIAGKPGYMAPEQFDGGAVDPRADVFSAGVVLHQALTGELPFRGETAEAQQEAARRGERERAGDLRGDVGENVEAILARALAPSSAARFPDARAMAQAIEALREKGQRLATGDDLADAVRAAQRELPAAGRRVIALTSPSASAAVPDSDDAPRELTRSGAPGSVGAFTLRFPVRADATTRQRDDVSGPETRALERWSAPEPRTERIVLAEPLPPSAPLDALPPSPLPAERWSPRVEEETADPVEVEGPRQRAVRRAALAAMLGVALLGVTALSVRARSRAEGRALSASSAPPPAASPALLVTLPVIASTAPPSAPSGAVRELDPRPARPAQSGSLVPRVAGSSAPSAVTPGSTPAAPADDCAGDVSFSSNGAWIIRGGPSTVESPAANVVWRCGTFNLVAQSRLDRTEVKSTTLTVSPKRRAVWDLR